MSFYDDTDTLEEAPPQTEEPETEQPDAGGEQASGQSTGGPQQKSGGGFNRGPFKREPQQDYSQGKNPGPSGKPPTKDYSKGVNEGRFGNNGNFGKAKGNPNTNIGGKSGGGGAKNIGKVAGGASGSTSGGVTSKLGGASGGAGGAGAATKPLTNMKTNPSEKSNSGKEFSQNLSKSGPKNTNNAPDSNAENATKDTAKKMASATAQTVDTTQRVTRMAAGDETAAKDYLTDPKKIWQDLKILGIAVGILVFVIVFLVIVIVVLILSIFSDPDVQKKMAELQSESTLTVTMTGPATGSADQYLKYEIHVVSSVPTTNIVVVDKIPARTQFYSAKNETSQGEFSPALNSVTWNSKNTPNPADATFTLIVRVDHDVQVATIINIANASSSEADGQLSLAPGTSDCGYSEYKKYMDITSDHLNFGDPDCSLVTTDTSGKKIFNKEAVIAYIRSQESQWYQETLCLADGLTQTNPNAYIKKSNGQYGYGLFLMETNTRTNEPYKYDNGRVSWKLQVSNAINYRRWVAKQPFQLTTMWNYWYWNQAVKNTCNI